MKQPLLILYAVLLVFCAGCATHHRQLSRPPFYALYHAYPELPPQGEDGVMHSVPEEGSWSMERQKRDLMRLKQAHLDGILLAITPQDLLNTEHYRRIIGFLNLCKEQNLQVIFTLTARKTISIDCKDLAYFLDDRELLQHPAFLKFGKTPVLCFTDKITLLGMPERYFLFRKLDTDWGKASLKPKLGQDGVCVVHAGKLENGNWQLTRRNGRRLCGQLDDALALHPLFIILSSWNDCTDGSAIEYNTLDNDAVFQRLSNY